MVMSFFRKGPTGLEHILTKSIGMLGDARHSFDLATLALLTETDTAAVDADIRETDSRINATEQELRSELVVHVSVQGALEIGTVLSMTLLLKKIERIGDQAKNVLDLAETGISLANEPDTEAMLAERTLISSMFNETAEILSEPSEEAVAELGRRGGALVDEYQSKIDGYLHSDRPGSEVVPRAIYYRYLKRIVANLLGIAHAATEPIQTLDHGADGMTDTDD
ncbi:MAG: PhoU domain-containing protein [Acidimicrobiia bacterium]|nr:PhoU domain-containing protein [Acidimicrobiia bacterium]